VDIAVEGSVLARDRRLIDVAVERPGLNLALVEFADESRDWLRWPASFRNGGRNQIGIPGRIASEFATNVYALGMLMALLCRRRPSQR
jgi:hypothetical protein